MTTLKASAAVLRQLEDKTDLEAARKALKEKGAIPWKDLKSKLGL